jgi:hypothetical protein
VDRHQPPGYYEAAFNGTTLASGLYLVRMHAGNFSSVRKMMLLK